MKRAVTRRAVVVGFGGLVACPAIGRAAWPDKTISIVHGFPGSNADVVARLLADGLARRLGATFVVEPKPGAGGTIAAAYVARAVPDGHTLMILVAGQAIAAAVFKQLQFKPVDDFTPISMLTEYPFVIATHPDHKARNGPEFIELARHAAEPVLVGTNGNGTGGHLFSEMLAARAGFKIRHVPYRSSGAAVTDLLGQRLDFMADTPTVMLPLVQDKQLRALATTGEKRFFALPDVPTVDEIGVKGYRADSWLGFAGPAGMPAEITARLNTAVRETLLDADVKDKLRRLGSEVAPTTPEAFKARLAADIGMWTEVVRSANIPRI